MWSVNKTKVTSVAGALNQFTKVLDGITKHQKAIADKAEQEIDILKAKISTHETVLLDAKTEISDAETATNNLLNVLVAGTTKEVK